MTNRSRALCCSLLVLVAVLCVWLFVVPKSAPDHALPASVSLDAGFDSRRRPSAAGLLSAEETDTLAAVCAEPSDAKAFNLFERGRSAMPWIDMMLGREMCKEPRMLELAQLPGSKDPAKLSDANLVALVARLKESGYGENPEAQLRTIIEALYGDGESFEHKSFVDLGSGRGKVLAAACTQLSRDGVFLFHECLGVEGTPARVAMAHELHAELQRNLTAVGEPALAAHLNSSVHLRVGDLRSALLASEIFPRCTHVYTYNTLFGVDLDSTIARLIGKHARRGVRIGLHMFNAAAWPTERFRVVSAIERGQVTWTAFTVLEVV